MADREPEAIYLAHHLAPLAPFLARDDVTDIHINAPREIWVETLGGATERHDLPELDGIWLGRLSRQIAASANQGINRSSPLLAASLPSGERVQIATPPVTRTGHALSIRKFVAARMRLSDYAQSGAFDAIGQSGTKVDAQLRTLADRRDFATLLSLAVTSRQNILIAGGTATGKTTFLNTLLREIPIDERLILIEDTPELEIDHPNAVGLIAARSQLREADVSAEDMLNASLRMRPDRIILGELRGPEAFTFLRAVNTGHPGSMTTIHADSPERAIEQLALLVLQSGMRLERADVLHYVRSTIDVFVQLGRVGGKRLVSTIALRGDV
jgi:type IV secretion system protein VirB11